MERPALVEQMARRDQLLDHWRHPADRALGVCQALARLLTHLLTTMAKARVTWTETATYSVDIETDLTAERLTLVVFVAIAIAVGLRGVRTGTTHD